MTSMDPHPNDPPSLPAPGLSSPDARCESDVHRFVNDLAEKGLMHAPAPRAA